MFWSRLFKTVAQLRNVRYCKKGFIKSDSKERNAYSWKINESLLDLCSFALVTYIFKDLIGSISTEDFILNEEIAMSPPDLFFLVKWLE